MLRGLASPACQLRSLDLSRATFTRVDVLCSVLQCLAFHNHSLETVHLCFGYLPPSLFLSFSLQFPRACLY